MRSDQGLDRRRVEITDGDDGHQIGPVPICVELLHPLVADVLNNVGAADGLPLRIARALEQDGELRILYALAGAQPEPPFFQDDAPLLVDLDRIEGHVAREVFEDEQRPVDHRGVARGDLQFVHRFVEAGVCVDVRTETHPERLHEAADVLSWKVPRAVEGHVLHEVREPALVVILEHGARVDDEPKLCATLGQPVLADVVAEPVRERADRNLRIDRHRLVEPGGLNSGGDSPAAARRRRPPPPRSPI